MPMPYAINTLPIQFVDPQGLQSLYDYCIKPGQRVAIIGYNESAKHLVNLCGDNIVCFYDPAEWKLGITFRGKPVLGAQEKHDITHIAVCDFFLAYDFAAEIGALYGGAVPVFVPPRLNQQATVKIDPFKQEQIYKDIFAQAHTSPISMLGHEKICFLMEMLRYALRLPGDVVEFGVWQGGGAWYIAKILAAYGGTRRLYLVDLFETLTNNRNATMCNEEIARALGFYPHVEMMVGLVSDAKITAQLAERKFCFAHYDLGFHPSTLENLWECLLPGAPLILDNYGHLAVSPLKFEQFFAERDARVIRMPWSDHGFVIKGT